MQRVFFIVITLFAAAFSSAAIADLSGVYKGIVAAQGMRLQFARSGDVYQGVFADRAGGTYAFEADVLASGAETLMVIGGRKLFARFTPDGPGVQMVTIPLNEEGLLITDNAQSLIFLDEAIDLPPRPARYIEPPQGPGGTIDPEAFVESYAFWPADNVAYGFGMVRGRYRTLIRLHSLVQTDILWKMCQSRAAPAILAEALRGQGASCQDILAAMGRAMEAGGTFNRFKQDVLAEKQALTLAIRCSIDYRRNSDVCRASGAKVAQAAVSLETVRGVLNRY